MEQRERRRDDHATGADPADPAGDSGSLAQRRRDAERFLAAGDEAIRRALESGGHAFLSLVRQHGGQ